MKQDASERPPAGYGNELRKIIHIDMDAFFASVEQRDAPELRGRPVAVGGARERGVVAAASYEARVYGVRSAMSSAMARRRCPELIFVKPRFDVYKTVSRQIRDIFAEYTPLIEPLSLDEAYLDVTDNLKAIPSATIIAQEIRARIRAETGLTASAGVSYNKFLAKIASDQNKPDGLCIIRPADGPAFVEALPIARFYGIGPVTASRMEQLGVTCGRDLKAQSRSFLQQHFGKSADYFYWAARGVDHRPVVPDRPRKSLGSETTFEQDLLTQAGLEEGLRPAVEAVWNYIARGNGTGRTLTLKARYSDFRQVTRSRTATAPITDRAMLEDMAQGLLQSLLPLEKGVRLLGLTLSNLETADPGVTRQLALGL